ncbi:MAG: hypothetical protein Q7J84_15590 [Sulfuricaulis sp.]|nr:hypothetical protein [Sulfuricaulis sp.]
MIRHIAKYCRAPTGAGLASTIALLMLVTGFAPALYAAKAPVLMILAHTEAGKMIETGIETKGGLVISPEKGKLQPQWIIRAGEAIKSNSRPGERAVNFYQGSGNQTVLLFIVKARYYPSDDGKWVARFQLNEEPLVVRVNGRWQPLSSVKGVPNLIARTGTALPNAEGYFSALEFGFTTGAISIDAWAVQ